jgi:hypothetical protein
MIFPTQRDERLNYAILHRKACQIMDVGKGSFNNLLRRALDTGELLKDPDDGKYYRPEIK